MSVARGVLAFLLIVAVHARAQETPAPALPAVPPPPPSYQTPPTAGPESPPEVPSPPPAVSSEAAAPAAPATPADQTCMPTCRTGFLCHQGQCISACNPPCPAEHFCSAEGECIPEPPMTSPSLFSAPPQTPPRAPGAERHDGFMLRLTLGFGNSRWSSHGDLHLYGTSEKRAEISGFGTSFSLDVGASPIDNLIIHFRLGYAGSPEPSLKLDNAHVNGIRDSFASQVILGPAVTYYFMPINIYITGALGISGASFDDGQNASRGNNGVGINFDVGKEWWVIDNLGLGVAARFFYAHTTNNTGEPTASYDLLSWALLFSATYQ